ncbi:DMT family transporter [Serratia ficaria]|uniref:DMT family transporter n=1 Tax=Serratia ficaria TaxID=61651 RepID=UPI00351F60A3
MLALSIILEVIGTTFLQRSEQFTRLLPTLMMGACYLGAFYLLSQVLAYIPIGVAYAMWSGLGIVLISLVGYIVFHQSLNIQTIIGIAFILFGVVIVNMFSSSALH